MRWVWVAAIISIAACGGEEWQTVSDRQDRYIMSQVRQTEDPAGQFKCFWIGPRVVSCETLQKEKP